jgi:LmbE family N-acetylglucosaminyl deacetylase
MKPFAPLTLAICLSLSTSALVLAQTPATFSDPANLAGERPSPATGYELPIDGGSPAATSLALQQLLRKLHTRASILNIVAHPDDEDGGMLILYARGLGATVADLSLTRGEGGQNAVTSDFDDALGLLRTQELLANDRYTGVSQMFGTEVDFGFSKTKSEAFAKWTHDRVLYDAVRAIRIVRPLVITSTWTGGVTDGHGQHQVSGQIAQEAFIAAGDPAIFPELTREGILPWQPLKMYARVPRGAITPKGLYDYATNQYVPARFTNYITHQTSTTPPSPDIPIHEGAPDPLLTTCAANPADLPPNLSPLRAARGSASGPGETCLPLSYIQFARIGLGLQKSQIPTGFRTAPTGAFDVPYHLYGSRLCNAPADARATTATQATTAQPTTRRSQDGLILSAAKDLCISPATDPPATQPTFFTGIDTSLQSLATNPAISPQPLDKLTASIDSAAASFNPSHPEAIVPALADALHAATSLIHLAEASNASPLDKANALHELRIKQTQLNQALTLALGLTLDALAPSPTIAATVDRPSIWLHLTAASGDFTLKSEIIVNSAGAVFHPIPLDEDRSSLSPDHAIHRNLKLEPDAFLRGAQSQPDILLDLTRPYFTRDSIETPVYKLLSPNLRNAPSAPPALTAWAEVDFRGETLRLGRVLHSGIQPVRIVPPASIDLSTHAQLLPNAKSSFIIAVSALATSPVASQTLTAPGWKAYMLETLPLTPAHGPIWHPWAVQAPSGPTSPTTLHADLKLKTGNTFTEGYRPVGYGDLPRTNLYTPATVHVVPADLNLPKNVRLAYLPGTGDDVPAALSSIGLSPVLLKVSDLTTQGLANYDTVILGVRTYAAHPDLHGVPTQALLDFARNGGNVLVQYQSEEFTAADAPFPLDLGENAKVVDETAPVELLPPTHSGPSALGPGPYTLLSLPNKITPHDFDNWFEERGHGFMATWDSHYTALTETHDPGAPEEGVKPQLPQRGGLLTTALGKGRWTYCAFALYRQLPEANPGAFRLFINLITPPTP